MKMAVLITRMSASGFKVLRNGLLRHVSFASTCTRGRCGAMLISLCHSCLRSHAVAITSCLIFFYVYTWDTRCYAMFTSASTLQMKKIKKTKITRKKFQIRDAWNVSF